jgi:carboxymethylenebutenolidase
MGETVILRAADGFGTTAYLAHPGRKPKGALVVVQEIFGVNRHMRGVADGFARDGYVAIVPALFDRIRPGTELGYAQADIARGVDLKKTSSTDAALLDIDAARAVVADMGKVGVIGYCWGGFLTWVAATRLRGFAAAVSYYGGGIGTVAANVPLCPVQLHFGETDHAITLAEVDLLREKRHKGVEIFLYSAGHGFNCDERGSFDDEAARAARRRAMAFFARHLTTKAEGGASGKTPRRNQEERSVTIKATAKTKTKTKAKAKTKTKVKAKTKPAARPKAAPRARVTVATKTKGKVKGKSAPSVKAKAKAKAKAKPAAQAKRAPARKSR